jgi:prepilin-type N-terminal cleavage/methylation domain-containing protein
MTDYRNTCFTLVEVIVALAILTMGLLAGLSLIASSQQRLTKASKRWHEQHLLTQAAEYFLLTNGSAFVRRCCEEAISDKPASSPIVRIASATMTSTRVKQVFR